MSKKLIGLTLALALFVVAVPASAASLSQTQISAIIGLLQSFGADQSTINQVAVTLGGSAPVTNTQCVDLTRDLTIGANSDQVLMLQRYLKNKGSFTEEPTGYYGFVTAQAVGKLQVSLGIVASSQDRSYGLMGPRTREMVRCGGESDAHFLARPGSGLAPLAVEFLATVGGAGYVIDFGDGVWGGIYKITPSAERSYGAPPHTYQNAGTYTAKLYSFPSPYTADCSRSNPDSSCKVIATATVTVKGSNTAGITVTAPNGGEQWEIGQLNTITWSPYGYNPDVNPAKDVTVFLERLDGSTAGQIMDTGKASLHTYFNIGGYDNWAEPGQYRVYVSNRVTGATDRSDTPFTLLPRAIDIKVNGSDGPVTLTDNQPVSVTFKLGTSFQSCMLNGVRKMVGGPTGAGLTSGELSTGFNGYAYAPTPGSATAIYVTCTKTDGTTRGDSVQVNMLGGSASLRVTSPNGGERLSLSDVHNISWREGGIKNVSVALYKNDQWYKWIWKDMSSSLRIGTDEKFAPWRPSEPETFISSSEVGSGPVFKIYITGQKADGTGYVDDKSDAPFSFINTVSPRQATADVILKMAAGIWVKDYRYDLDKDFRITTTDAALYLQGTNPSTEESISECSTAQSKRGQNSQNYTCVCPVGFARGVVWGGVVGIDPSSNPESLYTDDSNICTAAIHIGEAAGREAFYVTYKILPGQSSYIGTTANGITTRSYGPWPGSFKIGIKG